MKAAIALALSASFFVSPPVLGQSAYPARTVRIVVPFAPGGSTDILARTVALHLTPVLGHQVIVENRPGASGNIGADNVAKAPADGHSLIMGSIGTHATNALLYSKMPYDPVKDFSPITLTAIVTLVLVTHPSLPVSSVKDLIALAKARPGQVNYASGGNGASQHLAGELFKYLTGTNMQHLPYKGSAPALPDLLSGQVPVMFADMPLVMPHIQSGRLRALAVAGRERNPALPKLPTVGQAGVKDYYAFAWYALFAPANTPQEIIARLNPEVVKILKTPEIRDRLLAQGAEPVGSSVAELREFQASEISRWATVIKAVNIRLD
ncbi:MAG: tripartite tricarboxylate transporter substrate binding protein [Burkholderiales bacterium]|nr:tripartite tricarboxylate transporter substrate binding protein [Burkholderiales bacterium]